MVDNQPQVQSGRDPEWIRKHVPIEDAEEPAVSRGNAATRGSSSGDAATRGSSSGRLFHGVLQPVEESTGSLRPQ